VVIDKASLLSNIDCSNVASAIKADWDLLVPQRRPDQELLDVPDLIMMSSNLSIEL
jgi:hypothetical protein